MRICLFVDGSNLYATLRSLKIDIDYKKLITAFSGEDTLVRAYYYTALGESKDYLPIHQLVDWLPYNGYTTITKPIKEFIDPIYGAKNIKGNMGIEIAVDMLDMCPHYDVAVLFSGDGDFRSLVKSVQGKGKIVRIVSSLHTNPPIIADELRRQADSFVDLYDIRYSIENENVKLLHSNDLHSMMNK